MMAMSYGSVLRGADRLRGEGRADGAGLPRGRVVSGHRRFIIAYSHCIAHGYDLSFGTEQQRLAVESGVWPLYRFDPRRIAEGKPPLTLDSAPPKVKVSEYVQRETRYRMVEKLDPKRFAHLMEMAQIEATQRYGIYQQLAGVTVPRAGGNEGADDSATGK